MAREEDTCPLPQDPVLADAARAFRDSGQWVEIVDPRWCTAYMTDDLRLAAGFMVRREPVPLGLNCFGADSLNVRMQWRTGPIAVDSMRAVLTACGPWVLEDTPGGRDALRRHVGDGIVAFFLAENFVSESEAAGACIRTARTLRNAMAEARIEACATGGRTLASKNLVERLTPDAARALGLSLDRISYTQLGDLVTATEKARRDAPSIAVCEL